MRSKRMMAQSIRRIVVLTVLSIGLWTVTEAQTATPVTKVNYDTGTISWDWAKANPADVKEGVATEFHLYAGPTSGQYTYPMKPVLMPNKSILVRDLCPNQGPCFFVIRPANTYGEAPASAEIPLDAGNAPKTAVSNVKVQ